MSLPHFRIYGSDDVLGVALGGAIKDVLHRLRDFPTDAGLATARARPSSRGSFAELNRFGQVIGARADTLMGLSSSAGNRRRPARARIRVRICGCSSAAALRA